VIFKVKITFLQPDILQLSSLKGMLLPMPQSAATITNETRLSPISRVEKRRLAQADTRPRVTLSFYRYVRIADPQAFQERLQDAWEAFDCMGRIYVASEGINAQMNVPKQQFEAFDSWTQAQPELAGVPYKIAVEEGEAPSFYKLAIKVKDKIVADGLDDDSFDVTDTGEYLTAAEINQYVDDPDAVIVDMRNSYESEVGHFEGAITPNVETFRDELKVVPQTLKIHKNKKIALYCTGGIRCEKASAWLKHNGYAHVKHLKGGIIDYAHQVQEQGLPNKFKGKNFVFDERLGERIGADIISTCHVCRREKSDTHYHCPNQICFTLFLGCGGCIKKRAGYCSRRCQLVDKLPAKQKKSIARFYNQQIRPLRKFKKMRLS
jgi:UPF0176 protein